MSPARYRGYFSFSADSDGKYVDFPANQNIHLVLHIFSGDNYPLIHRLFGDNLFGYP